MTSIWLFVLLVAGAAAGSQPRTCCRYSCSTPATCPAWCTSDRGCVARSLTSPAPLSQLDNCTVIVDSKKDKMAGSDEECRARRFTGVGRPRLGSDTSILPFYLLAYKFRGASQQNSHFTGIDLRYSLDHFSRLQFRMENTNSKVCPGPLCHPRCVEVERAGSSAAPAAAFLSYDCEAGFYISGQTWVSTTGHTHRLSLCADQQCGQFLFRLPDLDQEAGAEMEQGLVLVELTTWQQHGLVELWVPGPPLGTAPRPAQFLVTVVREDGEGEQEFHNQTEAVVAGPGQLQRVMVTPRLSGGRFSIHVTYPDLSNNPSLLSPQLTRPEPPQTALAAATALLAGLLAIGLVLTVYRRWQTVAEQGAVEPGSLVAAGRLAQQAVLVITPLDSPDHVAVVRALCHYLKQWCGVATTYFALDEETGILSCGRDPWRWCQETGDLVSQGGGTILYIAGPDPALSLGTTSVFPNLAHNQAFLTTRHLSQLARQGRALVARLPYSNMKTLPQEVPEHMKSASYLLPRQMNEFLVHLLQVKRRVLCRLLPCPLVAPEILPASLAREGGTALLERIAHLTDRAALHRTAHLQPEISQPAAREISDLEETKTLLFKEIKNLNLEAETLDIKLEDGLPSIRDMNDREKMHIEND